MNNDINKKIKNLAHVIYPLYLNTLVLQNFKINLYQKIKNYS